MFPEAFSWWDQGNVVRRLSAAHGMGATGITVGTHGLGAGAYMVRIEAEGHLMTARVVVLGR